jgi:hypothetical protein
MKPQDQDKSNQPFEADLEALQRAYEGQERSEPSTLLDQAVLNMAKRELETQRTGPGSLWGSMFGPRSGPRWIGGLATAAVVVLAVNLILQQPGIAPGKQAVDSFEMNLDADPTLRQKAEGAENRASSADEFFDRRMSEPAEARVGQDRDQAGATEGSVDQRLMIGGARESGRIDAPAAPPQPVEEVSAPKPSLESFRHAEPDAPTSKLEELEADLSNEVGTENKEKAQERKNDSELLLPEDAGAFSSESPTRLETAEEWLGQLIALEEAGEHGRLREELRAFRTAFPDHALPESLLPYLD